MVSSKHTTVTARDNSLLVKLRKLVQEPTAYRKLGAYWLEGEHLCEVCIRQQVPVAACLITEEAWQQPTMREWAEHAERVVVVSSALFKSVSGLDCPAQIGFVMEWQASTDILAHQRTVILDRLQDAGNVGMILRSAAALGIEQVLALKGTAALWSAKVLRAAMGAHYALHLVESLDFEGLLPQLGVPLVATSSYAQDSLFELTLADPCAWIVGHEGQGIAPELLACCERVVYIPQPGGQESLNVAAAASICFYEAMRQRLHQ